MFLRRPVTWSECCSHSAGAILLSLCIIFLSDPVATASLAVGWPVVVAAFVFTGELRLWWYRKHGYAFASMIWRKWKRVTQLLIWVFLPVWQGEQRKQSPPRELSFGHDVLMHSTMVLWAIEALHFRGKSLTTLLLFPHLADLRPTEGVLWAVLCIVSCALVALMQVIKTAALKLEGTQG